MTRKTQFLIAGAGALAGMFAARAIGGKHIHTLPYGYGVKLKKAVTINSPAELLYSFWRDLQNITTVSDSVSVEVLDHTHSHWTVRVPGGVTTLQWTAEITVDRPGEMIGWRSLDGADIDNAGYVRFEPATSGRETVVRVALQYNPPAGKLGATLSSILGTSPEREIQEALRRFKQVMEAGEIPTTVDERRLPHSTEPVETASEDSFPASDPPAWTGTTGSM